MPFRMSLFIVAFVACAVGPGAAAAQPALGDERYLLPLFDPYAVLRSDRDSARENDRGTFQLVEETRPATGGASRQLLTLIPDLEQVGAEEGVIFGKSAGGFFIFDARQQPAPRPEMFESRDAWQAALDRFGVTQAALAPTPDALAALHPPHVLRPWKYRAMGGALGLSDDGWTVVVQGLAFAAAFGLGLAWPPTRRPPVIAALLLGLLSNVASLSMIGGGGAGAAVGFIALPVLCLIASLIGQAVRGGGETPAR